MIRRFLILTALVCTTLTAQAAETIGTVDTAFQWLGPDHKIAVDVYDDPLVKGISCYVSHPVKGGITGALGLASETSDNSIACRQVGAITFSGPIPKQDIIFKESTSILFKKMKVVRMVDAKRQTLVYLVYSDKLIDGSPKNSVTAVPVGQKIPLR